ERWPILGAVVDPEYFAGKTWEEDIQYMKTWITNRLAWIDAQFVPAPLVTQAPSVPTPTNAISFSAPTGQVYFTVDGTDPRLTNGSVSSAATAYQSPVAVKRPAKIVARARSANGWSSPVAVHMPE
ncbi:MAG TPA: FN3 associated domain-containing protein, partial [Methylomirabilota bacterium]|nr:FN3 associated domain-containing protein [Methylomirabilota bacterium]